MQVKSIDELTKNRKLFIEAQNLNGFTEGIHALLTDLYPDQAHFIYELLQNAEDLEAKKVIFKLTDDGFWFIHNGQKRPFTLEDVDSITSIGNNQLKKNDETAIGKFGVGFKSVYAYTASPYIYSNTYCFRVENYFVPVKISVRISKIKKMIQTKSTVFYLPFNHPNKPAKDAITEIRRSLDQLEDSTLLFLSNINELVVYRNDSQLFHITKNTSNDNVTTLSKVYGEMKRVKSSQWMVFSKYIPFIDEKGSKKRLPLSIAFKLKPKYSEVENKYQLQEVDGKINTYFPCEKEFSGLKFHINAPFASTVARDSIRDIDQNFELIKEIYCLLIEIIGNSYTMNLEIGSLLSVLPNSRDNLSLFFTNWIDSFRNDFATKKLLIDTNGNLITSNQAIAGTEKLQSLFDENALAILFDSDIRWIGSYSRNRRFEQFLRTVGVFTYSNETFYERLARNYKVLGKILSEKSLDWIRQFYLYLYSSESEIDGDILEDRHRLMPYESEFFSDSVKLLRLAEIVPDSNAVLRKPADISINDFAENYNLFESPVVHPYIFPLDDDLSLEDKNQQKIDFILRAVLQIDGVNNETGLKYLFSKLQEYRDPDEEYYNILRKILNNFTEEQITQFSSYPMVFGEYGAHSELVSAKKVYLTKKYGNQYGSILGMYTLKSALSTCYLEKLSKKEINILLNVLKEMGAQTLIECYKSPASGNPNYYSLLRSHGKMTEYKIDEDYSFLRIEKIDNKKNWLLSRLIWDSCLNWFGKEEQHTYITRARFRPNASAQTKTSDSTLLFYLNHSAWVPDRDGFFRKPSEVRVSDLHPSFQETYDEDTLLGFLEFGKSFTEEEQKIKKLKDQVEDCGLHVITEEEYQAFRQFQELYIIDESTNDKKSSKTLFEDNSKTQTLKPVGEEYYKSISSPNTDDIQEAFENNFHISDKNNGRKLRLVSESSDSEKEIILSYYHGECQICKTKIVSAAGKPIFNCVNLINTNRLNKSFLKTVETGWNSLSLCPNCAAKFKYCAKSMDQLYDEIVNFNFDKVNKKVPLALYLANEIEYIWFVPQHLRNLKAALKQIDQDYFVNK